MDAFDVQRAAWLRSLPAAPPADWFGVTTYERRGHSVTLRLGPPGPRVAVEVYPDSDGPRWVAGATPLDAWLAACAALFPWRIYGECQGRAEETLALEGLTLRREGRVVSGTLGEHGIRMSSQDPLHSWLRAASAAVCHLGRTPAVQGALASVWDHEPTAAAPTLAFHELGDARFAVARPHPDGEGWVLPCQAHPFVAQTRAWRADTELDAWLIAPRLSAMFLGACGWLPAEACGPDEPQNDTPLGEPSEASWSDPVLELAVGEQTLRIGREEEVAGGVHAVWSSFPDGRRRRVCGEPGQPVLIALSVWQQAVGSGRIEQ